MNAGLNRTLDLYVRNSLFLSPNITIALAIFSVLVCCFNKSSRYFSCILQHFNISSASSSIPRLSMQETSITFFAVIALTPL